MSRYFEFVEDKSAKFWEVTVLQETDVQVRYGRIGTNGQSMIKTFTTAAEANQHADNLIIQKTKKGYHEVQNLS